MIFLRYPSCAVQILVEKTKPVKGSNPKMEKPMTVRNSINNHRISRRDFARILSLAGGSIVLLRQSASSSAGTMLQFETQGDSFSRGKQQGQACRDLFFPWARKFLPNRYPWMKSHLQDRLEIFTPSWPQQLRALRQEVELWQRNMEEVYPEGFQECRGVAAGLGMDEITHFTVQSYDLILKPKETEQAAQAALPRKCTVVGTRDQQNRPLVGKTDDVSQWELGMNVLEITKPDKGYRHAHFHFAGTLWTVAGMNERGLAMGMNGIPAPRHKTKGISSLDALHTILPSCANVDEAIKHIRDLPLSAGGFSLLLGDANGKLSVVERTPAGMAVLLEKNREGLAHANEIVDLELARKNGTAENPIHVNSRRRYESALRDLKSGKDLEQILSGRSPQGAICQRGEDGMHTDFAVIFSPVEKKLKYWLGYTEAVEPKTLNLEAIFT
jgi:Acyl-coenzyme A:6-aminopenicillanic acid acyl-transferase